LDVAVQGPDKVWPAPYLHASADSKVKKIFWHFMTSKKLPIVLLFFQYTHINL
jgi:hypothetical protein